MHFALICPPFKSHITVFQALAAELVRRGHRASFVLNEGAEQYLPAAVEAESIAGTNRDQIGKITARAARPNGLFGILRTVSDSARLTDSLCRGGPARLRSLGVDAILGDQMEPAAGLIARHLGLPMMSIACALPIERGDGIPLPFLPWRYDTSERGRKRNLGGERVARLLLSAQRRTIAQWSHRFGLTPASRDMESCLSPLGTIAQTTEAFDFPRLPSERPLHAVGPLRANDGKATIPFPLDGAKPFVFMSLGTLQGHRYRLFRAASRACQRLGAQLLVAHCGGLDQDQANSLGATWVTDFAPQRAVLERADLCITHAGHNTVMDALEFGTPLLALPIAFDQPGIAARIVHHKVGLSLSRRWLSVARLERAIGMLLSDGGYRGRAEALGQSIAAAGGLMRAVDLIEETLQARAA